MTDQNNNYVTHSCDQNNKYQYKYQNKCCVIVQPDDVLRKGSGTLCEHLLMAEAFKAGIVFPNKHIEPLEKWHRDSLLYSETYVGGNVAQLNSGIYRSDLPENFILNPLTYQKLAEELDDVFGRAGVEPLGIPLT